MSTGIGNGIYVQGATQLEHGEEYPLVPEECQSLYIQLPYDHDHDGPTHSNLKTRATQTGLFKTRVALSLIQCLVHVININVLLTFNTNTKQ